MTGLSAATLSAAMDATWPPVRRLPCGPFTLRDGRGGGKRVSAATLDAPQDGPRDGPDGFDAVDIDAAEAGMARLGQAPLFRIHAGDEALDLELEARGYALIDPVLAYGAPVGVVAGPGPEHMSAFAIWPWLKICEDIWGAGGLGPERLAVMKRVAGPKTAVLSRRNERAAGACFAAISGQVAMVHALEVLPELRRRGSAVNMMRCAAKWAQDEGAEVLVCLMLRENAEARALFAFLNMEIVGYYHYRLKPM
jgi:GNAT superfamily N-acetyltransferase